MNPNFDTIGKGFVDTYYTLFDTNRSQLQPLYRDHSMLTFEGQQFQGAIAITQKLVALPFQAVKHVLTTVDCQPIPNNGVLVFVVGQLKSDDDHPHGFSQTFVLFPEDEAATKYYVMNDIFRLALHHG
ncbi:nuclear transport factor 2-like [Actinia tenebrosa]|uniref:Nuclear transport factor 2 n=1 Tax=Actinia tenebrosa TaxID=6105 RepID=A0A6P8IWP2_ACTTE|nr:nuclear transport factor 2-like [Actinia tenebrosa]